MRVYNTILAMLVILPMTVFADENTKHKSEASRLTSEEKKSFFWLYDLANRKFHKTDSETGKLLPDRVYMRWDTELQLWVLDLTGPTGRFARPSHHLKYGSVLPGEWLGEEAKTRWIYRKSSETTTWDEWSELADHNLPVKVIEAVSLGNGKYITHQGGDYRDRPGGLDEYAPGRGSIYDEYDRKRRELEKKP